MTRRRSGWVLAAIGLLGALCGCKGTIVSTAPLLSPADVVFPIASGTEIAGQRLDDHVWEPAETARLVIVDGAYGIMEPGKSEPSSDRFLVRRIGNGEFVVQAHNGSEWAYGLIVHADMYYVFTFNGSEGGCANLSPAERGMFHTALKEDQCVVGSLRDLIGLLRYLRRKFPHPASAFSVRVAAE